MSLVTTREALVKAAFRLFEQQTYDQTTVDDIAALAGVGRTTFFRQFRSKDEVVFPDHDRLLADFERRLTAPSSQDGEAGPIVEAGLHVLRSYVAEGDIARARYRLTSSVPTLRDRELASTSRYQRVLYEHCRRTAPGRPALDAELLSSTCMTVHNHVLRRWLRGRTTAPDEDLAQGVRSVVDRLTRPLGASSLGEGSEPDSSPAAIVLVPSDRPLADVLVELRRHLDHPLTGARPRRDISTQARPD